MNTGVYRTNEIIYNSLKDNFNKITFGDPSLVDMNKMDLFPLAHVSITNITNTRNTKTISYQIVIFDLIDENNLEETDIKNNFRLTNNLEDVIHDLDFRFMKTWGSMKSLLEETPDSVNLELLYSEGFNKLAGYEINFDIILEQNGYC
jgi:hypothetical protein